jgi:ketosteroid isomerase-like protein
MSIKTHVKDLNGMILSGNILGAFEKYYADNVVMQESGQEPVRGKEANRKREEEFVNNLTDFRGAEVSSIAVDEENDVAMVEWYMDYTHKAYGDVKMKQIAVQRWRDGKIYDERFYAG